MAYAEGTEVTVEKSEAELKAILRKFGADQIATMEGAKRVQIAFRAHGRFVRLDITMPDPNEKRFWLKPNSSWQKCTASRAAERYDAERRRRWRVMVLVLKAKLEMVTEGAETFEQSFMAHMVLPGGGTVAEWLAPQLSAVYEGGEMPRSLPMLGSGSDSDG